MSEGTCVIVFSILNVILRSAHDFIAITQVLRDCLYWKMTYLGDPLGLHGFEILRALRIHFFIV